MLLILLIKLCGLKKILIFRYIVVLVFAPVNEFRRDEFPQWINLLARNTQSPRCEHQRSIQTRSFSLTPHRQAREQTRFPKSKPVPNEVERFQTGLRLSSAPTKMRSNA